MYFIGFALGRSLVFLNQNSKPNDTGDNNIIKFYFICKVSWVLLLHEISYATCHVNTASTQMLYNFIQ